MNKQNLSDMKKTITTDTSFDFPGHLAYGLANITSWREEDGFVRQDYLFRGEMVMTISLKEGRAEIQEYWKGRELSFSSYPTLKQAALYHFAFTDQSNSPVHEYWARSIAGAGNIYVEYLKDGQGKTVYFPDVYLITLRIPVKEENLPAAFSFMQHSMVRYYGYRYYKTKLFITRRDGGVHSEDIHLLEVTTPMAWMYQLVVSATAEKVILKDKLHRAFVQPRTGEEGHGIKFWSGLQTDAWKNYSILFTES